MVCVGILEELIFRGFLFVTMAKENVTTALIVSALTFGLGHIINLLNGAPVFSTLMQIIFATVVGFTLAYLFYKGGSLVPGIIFHSLNNALAAIEKTNVQAAQVVGVSETTFELVYILCAGLLLVIYCIFSIRKLDGEDREF